MSHNGTTQRRDRDTEVDFNRTWGESVFGERPMPRDTHRFIVVEESSPGATKVGRSTTGAPISMGGKIHERGIGVHSHSVLRVELAAPAQRFAAVIGTNDTVRYCEASVRFYVQFEGRDVFSTDVMRPEDGVQAVDVPLNGATSFELVVDNGGDWNIYDHANWADARIVMEDGSELWLDDLARSWTLDGGPPFSFVYGGRHSSEFLGDWDRTVDEEALDDGSQQRTLTYTDPTTGLEARAVAVLYSDSPGVDWTLHFTNNGSEDTSVIEHVHAVDVTIAPSSGRVPELHQLAGCVNALEDWHPRTETLTADRRVDFASLQGKASLHVSPFFDVQWADGGVIAAVGWSGQWRGAVERIEDAAIRLDAGMEHLHLKLRPGESIRSPRVMLMFWQGDDVWRAYNLFRRTMLNHVVPKVNGKTATPPIAHLSTAFYETNLTSEENVLSHLDAIKGLGFEILWIDAYWTRGGFPYGMGNYGFPLERAVATDRLPRGLRPISDAAAQEGMGLLIWLEPERVARDTYIARETPEYVISPSGDGGGLYNLGKPEALRYMTDYLKAVVGEYRLAWIRFDYNLNPLPFWQYLNDQDPDRVGIGEIRYVEGLYQMWDEVLEAHPHLMIDNCAGGGTRIDLETCSRSIPLWRTDGTIASLHAVDFDGAALRNQIMTAGLSRYIPFHVSGQMGVTPYQFRSGYNAGISFGEDCRPDDYPRDVLKKAIAEGKRIRKYYFGNFYAITEESLDTNHWCVLQYHRPNEHDGMVMAFRRDASPYDTCTCVPREIDPEAEYEVTYSAGCEPSEPQRLSGQQVRSLRLGIDDCPGSLLVEYKKLTP